MNQVRKKIAKYLKKNSSFLPFWMIEAFWVQSDGIDYWNRSSLSHWSLWAHFGSFLYEQTRQFRVVKPNAYEYFLKSLLNNSVLSISFELIISSFKLSKSMRGMKNMRNWSPSWKYMSHKFNSTFTSILAANKLRNQTWA